MKVFFSLIAMVFYANLASAQVIKGIIYLGPTTIQYASIHVYNEKDSLLGSYLSNSDGSFSSHPLVGIPNFRLTVSYVGTRNYTQSFSTADLTGPILIHLVSNITEIDTVLATGEPNNTTLELNKRVYRFNPNDFIKHTTADIAINKVPGLFFAEGIGLKIDGQQNAQLYIDGIATNVAQLKTMEFEDIKQIEIVNHPTARYNVESNTGIINIITKPRSESFYKGRLGFTKGILLKRTGINPSFSLKKDKWLFKTALSLSNYNQETNSEINRTSTASPYTQISDRDTRIKQQNVSLDVKYDLDSSASLYLKSEYFGYGLAGFTAGRINNTEFMNTADDKYWLYTLDGVYDKYFKDNLFSIKSKYNSYKKADAYRLNKESTIKTNSGLSDISIEASYSHSPLFFKKAKHDFGLKYVGREFIFFEDKDFKQYNSGAYSDWQISLNNKIDVSSSMYLDISSNAVNNKRYTYTSLLPTINLAIKSGKSSRISLNYKRRVNRPSPMDLNTDLIILDPTTYQRGNANLKQSWMNDISLNFAKPYKKNFFSASLFYNINNRSIFENVENIKDTLIFTKDNIGTIQRLGGTVGHDLLLIKGLTMYTSVGLNYNHLEKKSDQHIYNSGIGFMSSINITARLFKKVTSALLFDYNPKKYDLYSSIVERPFTSFLASTNVFKDKFNLRFSYVDLFKINAKRNIKLNTPAFSQSSIQYRNYSNINLSITYIFGKKFADSITSKATKYDDIELR